MRALPDLANRFAWAFPTDAHHQLLYAAIGRDNAIALHSAEQWFDANNLDDCSFRSQRLLLPVLARFGQQLKPHAAYARLVGMQRLLWSRSKMAVQESREALQKITEAEISVLLIKGASRLAIAESQSKRRVAWDIDIVVPPSAMGRAFEVLVDHGWLPSPGHSPQCIRKYLPSYRSINFFRGAFGDLDLHRQAFYDGNGFELDDARLWGESIPASLSGIPVMIPRPEYRIAMAIAHSAGDGHSHSDWMVDCVTTIQEHEIDWSLFQDIVAKRRIAVCCAIAFHYFHDYLHLEIPRETLDGITRVAKRRPTQLLIGLVQSRPKEKSGLLGAVLRGGAKKYRNWKSRRSRAPHLPVRMLRVKKLASVEASDQSSMVKSWALPALKKTDSSRNLSVEIVIDVNPSKVRRRIELEINSPREHVARARYYYWMRTSRKAVRLQLSGFLGQSNASDELALSSYPSRQLRSYASDEERAKYDSVPFRVVAYKVAGASV